MPEFFPLGFKTTAVAAGIKKSGLDLGLIVSDRPATAAAVFTKNSFPAAPVLVSRAEPSGFRTHSACRSCQFRQCQCLQWRGRHWPSRERALRNLPASWDALLQKYSYRRPELSDGHFRRNESAARFLD